MIRMIISDRHENTGLTVRAIILKEVAEEAPTEETKVEATEGEAAEGKSEEIDAEKEEEKREERERSRLESIDFLLPYRPKAYGLRLIQNPLVNYKSAMAMHDSLSAKGKPCRGIWIVAHWYALEEYLQKGMTVGMSVAAWEGLHRNTSVQIIE